MKKILLIILIVALVLIGAFAPWDWGLLDLQMVQPGVW